MPLFDEIQKRMDAASRLFQNPNSFPVQKLEDLANQVSEALANGNRIAFVGNGGSAAEAMHLSAEFTGKCVRDHRPLSVLCLNESQSALTAIANDYGVEFMFSRQVEAHLSTGDILIALSTSGKSRNILKALESASRLGVVSHLWMGDFSIEIDDLINVWQVPSKETPRIQELHLLWGHVLAEVVELSF